ncbi:MAG TPA: nucleotidyltransferase domain-containing protein [Ktedonobacterales bacterium]|nr:nucleotidyltransferase domain-containing protein [Ktedonobacterales bacterium]
MARPARTSNTRIDHVLQEALARLEAAFPGRIRACYIEGSYAVGIALTTSDLDLTIVFCERFKSQAEREQARHLCSEYAAQIDMELDVEIVDEASLQDGVYPQFKLASQLFYGVDIRAYCPLISMERWTRERMHAAYWLMIHVFNRPALVHLPLTAPDPSDRFLGYTNRTIRLLDGSSVPSTRNLIRTTGWAATALIAWQTERYVTSKRNCHMLYRNYINDEWAGLLDDLYSWCRSAWQYLVPESADDQQRLQAICRRALAFENHFLVRYKAFLLTQLQDTTEEVLLTALHVMSQLPFNDVQMRETIQALARDKRPDIQTLAQETLTLLQRR